MYRSLLMLGAFLCSFAQISHAQCTANIFPTINSICEGQSATFTATTGGDIYQWYIDGQPTGTNSEILVINNQPPGFYQITAEVTFGACVTTSGNSALNVTPLPAPTALNSMPCTGGILSLVCTGNIPMGSTFQWVGPNGFFSVIQNPNIPNVTPAFSGIYTVTVNYNGCTASASTNVNIGTGTPVTASNNGPVCIGDVLQLSANTVTGATYSWNGPGGFTSNQQNPTITVDGSTMGGIYTVNMNSGNCTTTDTTHVIVCNTIFVDLYNDENTNCIYDAGIDFDPYLPITVQVDSNGINVGTISATSGFYYTALGNSGDVYSFQITSLPGAMVPVCPVTGIVNHTVQMNTFNTLEMGVDCGITGDFDLGIMATNPTTNAISQSGHIYVTNSYCSETDATVTLVHSPDYQYLYGAPAPTSVTANTVTWDLNDLTSDNPAPYYIYYHLGISGSPMMAGDTTHSHFMVTPITGDLNPSNNTFFILDTVIASLDPNAITAYPQACVTAGTKLQYMIQFENVGNAPAEDIYVLDTLPVDLDINTMELVMSSHNMFVTKIQSGGYNVLRFDFQDINLPDSSNHAECHGMLMYIIDLNSALPYGAEVFHQAGIYFDYNAVVMTNNERTSVCIPQNVSTTAKDGGIILYPNPAGDELTVQTDGSFINATITNSIGQVMMEQPLDKKQQRINISSLAPGMYYININGAQGNEVLKFLKR